MDEPLLIVERGEGNELIDVDGSRYLDGISSLWCNVHGHAPEDRRGVRDQLEQVAHSTLLGMATAVDRARAAAGRARAAGLTRVFYSDSAPPRSRSRSRWPSSTGAARRGPESVRGASRGLPRRHDRRGVRRRDRSVPRAIRPAAVRRAAGPRRRDATWTRLFGAHARELAALIVEPLVQGAAGMLMQPPGFLARCASCAAAHDVLLICDEVATGFGRTGTCSRASTRAWCRTCCASQGPHRRLPSARGDPRHRAGLRGFLGDPRSAPSTTATPTRGTRWPARSRSRPRPLREERTLERLQAKSSCSAGCSSRSPPRRGGRGTPARFHGGHRARRAPAAGRHRPPRQLEARRRGVIIRPLGDVVVLMPPLSIARRPTWSRLVEITAEAIDAATAAAAPARAA